MDDVPLPLIVKAETILFDTQGPQRAAGVSLATYGYLLITATWLLFVVTVVSFFRLWIYIIEPLRLNSRYSGLHQTLSDAFAESDQYVMRMWGIYVIAWWWAMVSWNALKLFRHAKGIYERKG